MLFSEGPPLTVFLPFLPTRFVVTPREWRPLRRRSASGSVRLRSNKHDLTNNSHTATRGHTVSPTMISFQHTKLLTNRRRLWLASVTNVQNCPSKCALRPTVPRCPPHLTTMSQSSNRHHAKFAQLSTHLSPAATEAPQLHQAWVFVHQGRERLLCGPRNMSASSHQAQQCHLADYLVCP